MNKGIKIRLYPNKEQQNFINRIIGCCRLVYNKGLRFRNEAFKNGEKVSYSATSSMLTELKKQEAYSFLKDADSVALQQALRDLDRAFVNFFQKRAGHPVFRSKHSPYQSYRTLNQNGKIRIEGRYLRLPKLGPVKCRVSTEIPEIRHVTVSKTPSGKYYAVLNVEFTPADIHPGNNAIGIDVGIKDFYTDSNGKVVENPKFLEKTERKLAREQRKLSKKRKYSRSRRKQRMKVARLHEKIHNQRNDFLQKQSTMLIRENQTVCIEDLHVRNMIKNRKLAKHIASASWSRFFDMLEYKGKWYGNDIIRVPVFYPSSQLCSVCNYKNPEVKNLAVRKWICPVCHTEHGRDVNAGVNILNKGLSLRTA